MLHFYNGRDLLLFLSFYSVLFVRFASFVRGEQLRGMTWDDACCPDQRFSTQLSCISPKQPTVKKGDVKYMNTRLSNRTSIVNEEVAAIPRSPASLVRGRIEKWQCLRWWGRSWCGRLATTGNLYYLYRCSHKETWISSSQH